MQLATATKSSNEPLPSATTSLKLEPAHRLEMTQFPIETRPEAKLGSLRIPGC